MVEFLRRLWVAFKNVLWLFYNPIDFFIPKEP